MTLPPGTDSVDRPIVAGPGLRVKGCFVSTEAMDGRLEYERRGEWTLFELRLPLVDVEG
jgi:hypothetical protein